MFLHMIILIYYIDITAIHVNIVHEHIVNILIPNTEKQQKNNTRKSAFMSIFKYTYTDLLLPKRNNAIHNLLQTWVIQKYMTIAAVVLNGPSLHTGSKPYYCTTLPSTPLVSEEWWPLPNTRRPQHHSLTHLHFSDTLSLSFIKFEKLIIWRRRKQRKNRLTLAHPLHAHPH